MQISNLQSVRLGVTSGRSSRRQRPAFAARADHLFDSFAVSGVCLDWFSNVYRVDSVYDEDGSGSVSVCTDFTRAHWVEQHDCLLHGVVGSDDCQKLGIDLSTVGTVYVHVNSRVLPSAIIHLIFSYLSVFDLAELGSSVLFSLSAKPRLMARIFEFDKNICNVDLWDWRQPCLSLSAVTFADNEPFVTRVHALCEGEITVMYAASQAQREGDFSCGARVDRWLGEQHLHWPQAYDHTVPLINAESFTTIKRPCDQKAYVRSGSALHAVLLTPSFRNACDFAESNSRPQGPDPRNCEGVGAPTQGRRARKTSKKIDKAIRNVKGDCEPARLFAPKFPLRVIYVRSLASFHLSVGVSDPGCGVHLIAETFCARDDHRLHHLHWTHDIQAGCDWAPGPHLTMAAYAALYMNAKCDLQNVEVHDPRRTGIFDNLVAGGQVLFGLQVNSDVFDEEATIFVKETYFASAKESKERATNYTKRVPLGKSVPKKVEQLLSESFFKLSQRYSSLKVSYGDEESWLDETELYKKVNRRKTIFESDRESDSDESSSQSLGQDAQDGPPQPAPLVPSPVAAGPSPAPVVVPSVGTVLPASPSVGVVPVATPTTSALRAVAVAHNPIVVATAQGMHVPPPTLTSRASIARPDATIRLSTLYPPPAFQVLSCALETSHHCSLSVQVFGLIRFSRTPAELERRCLRHNTLMNFFLAQRKAKMLDAWFHSADVKLPLQSLKEVVSRGLFRDSRVRLEIDVHLKLMDLTSNEMIVYCHFMGMRIAHSLSPDGIERRVQGDGALFANFVRQNRDIVPFASGRNDPHVFLELHDATAHCGIFASEFSREGYCELSECSQWRDHVAAGCWSNPASGIHDDRIFDAACDVMDRLAFVGLQTVKRIKRLAKSRLFMSYDLSPQCPTHGILLDRTQTKWQSRTFRAWEASKAVYDGQTLDMSIQQVQGKRLFHKVSNFLGTQQDDTSLWTRNRRNYGCTCAGMTHHTSNTIAFEQGVYEFDLAEYPVWNSCALSLAGRIGSECDDAVMLELTRGAFARMVNSRTYCDENGMVKPRENTDPTITFKLVYGHVPTAPPTISLTAASVPGPELCESLVMLVKRHLRGKTFLTTADVILDGCDSCMSTGKTRRFFGHDFCAQCAPTSCGCVGHSCVHCRKLKVCRVCSSLLTRIGGRDERGKLHWRRACPDCDLHLVPKWQRMIKLGYYFDVEMELDYPGSIFQVGRRQGLKPAEIRDETSILHVRTSDGCRRVYSTRDLEYDPPPQVPGASALGVCFNACIPTVSANTDCEVQNGLLARQLKDQPPADEAFLAEFKQFVKDLLKAGMFGKPVRGAKTNDERIRLQDFLDSFPPARKKQLIGCHDDLKRGFGSKGEWKFATKRSIFGKTEKLEKGRVDVTDESWAGRIISSLRTHHVSLVVGPHIQRIMQWIKAFWNVDSGVCLASGYDSTSLGKVFERASHFKHVHDADHSKFDSSIRKQLLEIEHMIYRHFGLHRWSRAWWCVRQQLQSKFVVNRFCDGQLQRVAWGSFEGRRNSGDNNTTLGNSLINALCVLFCLYRQSSHTITSFVAAIQTGNEFFVSVIGDDLMLAAEIDVERFLADHRKFGLELEFNANRNINAVCFAGCRSVRAEVDGREARVAIPQVERWATKIGWSTFPMPSAYEHLANLRSCWEPTLGDLPFFSSVLRHYPRGGRMLRKGEEGWNQIQGATRVHCGRHTRTDLCEGLGVSPLMLERMESTLARIDASRLPVFVGGPVARAFVCPD